MFFFSLQYPAEGRKWKPSAAWPVSTWQRRITLTCSGQPCRNSLVRSKEKLQFSLGMAQGVGMGSGSRSGTGRSGLMLPTALRAPCCACGSSLHWDHSGKNQSLIWNGSSDCSNTSGRGKPTKSKGAETLEFLAINDFPEVFSKDDGYSGSMENLLPKSLCPASVLTLRFSGNSSKF